MITIQTNPLVLAAALGLLGPAALAEDDDDHGAIGGMWARSSGEAGPAAAATVEQALPSSTLPARLGEQLQVLPVEDAFVIDDGTRAPNGSWDTEDGIVQTIVCDSGSVKREFFTEGDALTVHTIVTCSDTTESISYTDVYTRVS